MTLVGAARTQPSGFEGKQIALTDEAGNALAVMDVEEAFDYDKQEEARLVYRTDEDSAPRRRRRLRPGRDAARRAGPRSSSASSTASSCSTAATPRQTRAAFAERGWKTIVGFQTRNPVHRAHEYIQKCAMETVDGLLLHPLVGATKDDDIPADVRMACYEALLSGLLPGRPRAALRLPGGDALRRPARGDLPRPRAQELRLLALHRRPRPRRRRQLLRHLRRAAHLRASSAPGELGITPMFFENSFFCRACGSMGTAKTCPHGDDDHVSLSGTRVREMLAEGEMPPVEFSRPEVAQILIDASEAAK